MSWGLPPTRPPGRRPPEPPTRELVVPREVLNELARGFLLGLRAEDPRGAARFASQFLTEQSGGVSPEAPRARPRTVTGPLPRASAEGRTLEPRS